MRSTLSRPIRFDMPYGSLHNEEDRIRGEFLASFVADVIQVRRAGEFVVSMAFPQNLTSDRILFEVEARDRDGNALGIPYPVWENLPDWAMWWTVSGKGDIRVYAEKPQMRPDIHMWLAEGKMWFVERIEIPLGIDWRTLCFERPLRKLLPKRAADDSWPQSSQIEESTTEAQATAWWRKLVP